MTCGTIYEKYVGRYAAWYTPLRLKRRVKVLPQPGTGQAKWASFFRLVALASCVAEVVTCCFSTCKIGGSRGTPLDEG